jgi:hypothetical protein
MNASPAKIAGTLATNWQPAGAMLRMRILMRTRSQFSGRQNIAIALCTIAIGAYVTFAVAGLAPLPQGSRGINGPVWIGVLCGAAFVLAGLLVLSRGLAGDGSFEGAMPADAPFWLRLTQYVCALILFAVFAAVGTWVAVGPGTRTFNMSVPWFFSDEFSESFGRFAFGVGALITWACTIAVAVTGARKLFGQRQAQ